MERTEGLVLAIGDKNLSSWSMRPWLALKTSKLSFEEKNIVLDRPDTAENIRKYSPSGRVPVLIHGKTTIWDSLAICEYIAELAPEAELWPELRHERAHARSIASEMHSSFSAIRSQLSMDIRLRMQVNHLTSDTVADIRRVVAIWKECLSKSSGPFLFGKFTIADAFYAPIVMRFRSYGIDVLDKAPKDYMENVCNYAPVQEWVAGAERETNTKFSF